MRVNLLFLTFWCGALLCVSPIRAGDAPDRTNKELYTLLEKARRCDFEKWEHYLKRLTDQKKTIKSREQRYRIDCTIVELLTNRTPVEKKGEFIERAGQRLAAIQTTYPGKEWDAYFVYLKLWVQGNPFSPLEQRLKAADYAQEVLRNLNAKLKVTGKFQPHGREAIKLVANRCLKFAKSLERKKLSVKKHYTLKELSEFLSSMLLNRPRREKDDCIRELLSLRKSTPDREKLYLIDCHLARLFRWSWGADSKARKLTFERARKKLDEIMKDYPEKEMDGHAIFLMLVIRGDRRYAPTEDRENTLQLARDILTKGKLTIKIDCQVFPRLRQELLIKSYSLVYDSIYHNLRKKHKLSFEELTVLAEKKLVAELKRMQAPEDLVQDQTRSLEGRIARLEGRTLKRGPHIPFNAWPTIHSPKLENDDTPVINNTAQPNGEVTPPKPSPPIKSQPQQESHTAMLLVAVVLLGISLGTFLFFRRKGNR